MVKILQPITSTWLDYPNKEDCALVVVMMGCDNGCPFCQNPDFQNPDYMLNTKDYTVESLIDELVVLSKKHHTDKVVLSGGDPLSCFNIKFTKELLLKTTLKVCVYTGHSIDYVKLHNVKGFEFIKCGVFDKSKFQQSEKTDEFMRFASTNQKLFDSNYCCLSQNGLYLF